MKEEYLVCKKCQHENYVDPHCEIPVEMYTCDGCGDSLKGVAPTAPATDSGKEG